MLASTPIACGDDPPETSTSAAEGELDTAGGSGSTGSPDTGVPESTGISAGTGTTGDPGDTDGTVDDGNLTTGAAADSSGVGDTCEDGVHNGSESDVDCGGSSCAKCPDGNSCTSPEDCMGGSCNDGHCSSGFAACTFVDGSSDPVIVGMAANFYQGLTLQQAMAEYYTPGVSVAYSMGDGVVHTAVFGESNSAATLGPTTLFQAASMSKPISAVAYLMSDIVDATLDADIGPTIQDLLTLPYVVTPADLLSHTAGASGHGYGGYAPGQPLPSVDQIVLGSGPANHEPVSFSNPGPWDYSGPGYMVWQAWLERTIDGDLATFVHDKLFVPANVTRSNFGQPLSASEQDAACGYDPNLSGCANVYPELAAAGLWTTPSELTCLGNYLAAMHPDVLDRVTSHSEVVTGYPQRQGLGFMHRPANGVDESEGHFFEHGGANYGLCGHVAFFDDGRAVAAMDNSCEGGSPIAIGVLCRELSWPCAGPNLSAG